MPPGPLRTTPHARARHPALLLMAAALAIVPGLPLAARVAGPDDQTGIWSGSSQRTAAQQARVASGSGWSVPEVGTRAWSIPIDSPGGATTVASQRSSNVGDPLPINPLASAPLKPAAPSWTGGFNLYRKTAFVTQKAFKWCVAASVQMMVNIVRHKADRTIATQKRMIAYAQSNDHGPWGPGGGTDVTGWIVALRHFGAGKYRAVGASTPGVALRIAAIAMRQTGRPAGMLVMDGQHAWVLHGFESKTDPRRDRKAKISSVRVSGPLYPIQQKAGYDMRPNTELSVRALARYFHPSSVGTLVGKYVVIVPVH